MPSATLTFIVSLDDGVQAADTADALPIARPNPVRSMGLHVRASHVRQGCGQAGVQLVRASAGLARTVRGTTPKWCSPLADTDYGAREFVVRDPEGNLWSFGDYTGEQRD